MSYGYGKKISQADFIRLRENLPQLIKFYVSPLIPLLSCKEYFYLLVISKQKCKLCKADACGMEYIHVPDLPEDMMKIKRISEKDASTVRVGSSSGAAGANFHGMGVGNPDDKANIATYLEYVDDILYKQIVHNELTSWPRRMQECRLKQ